jgi:hypothetical protein
MPLPKRSSLAVLLALLATAPLTGALALDSRPYQATSLSIDGVVGKLIVTVDRSASSITLGATGPTEPLGRVTVKQSGDAVTLVQEQPANSWNNSSDKSKWITVTATVPAGTRFVVDGFVGEGTVGDLAGPLEVDDLYSGTLTVGAVSTAKVDISGSGDVKIGDIERDLKVDIDGSGDVTTGRAPGRVQLRINGSGNITVAAVSGPVETEINGSGDIKLAAGQADTLRVEIAGSGSFTLDGVALAQEISQSGSGKVSITGKR